MTDAGQDIKETMDALLENGLDLSTEEYSSIQDSLISGCNCKRCGEWCRLPVITPCRHLLCLDCVSLDSEKCTFPGCGYLYEMQTPETLARPENPMNSANKLTKAGIKFAKMYNPVNSANKMKSLAMFQNDADCMALVMDGSAALGLDLSFVTHVFLMEPIWDKSMEEQVISRAHRMGAKRPIYVETLTMCGTIEEQMVRFLEDAEKSDGSMSGDYIKVEQETTRVRRTLHELAESNYLSRLSFVRSDDKMECEASQLGGLKYHRLA